MGEEKKKGFVVYVDLLDQIEPAPDEGEPLTMEQRGLLFTAMLKRAAGLDVPKLDPETAMAFRFVSAQMRRDAEKYERTCQRRREAGEKGGRPPKANGFSENQSKAKKANGFSENQSKAKKPDTDTETDTETDTDKDTVTDTDTEGRAALAAMRPGSKPARKRKTKFNNFPERVYDIAALEKALIN